MIEIILCYYPTSYLFHLKLIGFNFDLWNICFFRKCSFCMLEKGKPLMSRKLLTLPGKIFTYHQCEHNWEHQQYLHNTWSHWTRDVLGFPHCEILLGSTWEKYQCPLADEWRQKACNKLINVHNYLKQCVLWYRSDIRKFATKFINLHTINSLKLNTV